MVATCYLLGVSHRVDGEARVLGHHPAVEVQVSEMAKDLDAHVADLRHRPLDAGPYTFVAADALVLKVREGGRMVDVIGATSPGAAWRRCRTHYAAT